MPLRWNGVGPRDKRRGMDPRPRECGLLDGDWDWPAGSLDEGDEDDDAAADVVVDADE